MTLPPARPAGPLALSMADCDTWSTEKLGWFENPCGNVNGCSRKGRIWFGPFSSSWLLDRRRTAARWRFALGSGSIDGLRELECERATAVTIWPISSACLILAGGGALSTTKMLSVSFLNGLWRG